MTLICENGHECPAPDGTRCPTCLGFVPDLLDYAIDCYWRRSTIGDDAGQPYLRKQTFREKVKLAYPRVERGARTRTLLTYDDVWGNGIHPTRVSFVLGAIADIEYRDGRPILSSVVVNTAEETPGRRFFSLVARFAQQPRDLGEWPRPDRVDWWRDEVERVFDYWATR